MFSLFGILKGLLVQNDVDRTKQLVFQTSPSSTTNTTTTITAVQTSSQNLNLPDTGATDTFTTNAATQTLTNKTIDTSSNTISNIVNANISPTAAIAVSKLAAQTANRALQTDASGFLAPSVVTSTELGYVSGVTSSIQAQLNSAAINPMTTLGDTLYENATPAPARLPGNITATKKFLSQTGTGTISAAPSWQTVTLADIPTVDIAHGGTGQTTKAAAFDALSPMTAKGDLIVGGVSGANARLAGGSTGNVLLYDTTQTNNLKWGTAAGTASTQVDLRFFTTPVTGYLFAITPVSVTAGAVYSNNAHNFTVLGTLDGGQTFLSTSGALAPTTSGTLSKVSGTGPATITFSAATAQATYTTPANCIAVKITMVAGGGGGGGTASVSTQGAAGGGGGGGGGQIIYITTPAASYPFSIGLGGAGGVGNAAGAAGGFTFLGTSSSTGGNWIANGGLGGGGSIASSALTAGGSGGSGGSAQNGNFQVTGQSGNTGMILSASVAYSGNGGNTGFGTGGAGVMSSTGANNGNAYGGGGSGAVSTGTHAAQTAGAGADGIMFVEEFY